MVKDRQEHTPFQVFDAGCELNAAAGNSTTGLTDDIRGQHGPSWANQTVNSHALAVIPPTAARTTRVDRARRPTVQHDAMALNAARAPYHEQRARTVPDVPVFWVVPALARSGPARETWHQRPSDLTDEGGLMIEVGEPIRLDLGIETGSNAFECDRAKSSSRRRVVKKSSDRSCKGRDRIAG